MHDQSFETAFGSAIRRRRDELGLKQVELADLARCSTRFVHTVEAGKATVRLDKLLDLLEVLGLGLRLGAWPRLSVDEPATGGTE
jgi:y4mF family transcriptional regulator